MLGANPTNGLSFLPNAQWLNIIGYVFSAVDGIVTIYDNLQQGNSLGQALLNGVLSFAKSAVSVWVGGYVGGYVGGAGVGIVVSWFVDDILGLIKNGLLDLIFDQEVLNESIRFEI